MNRRTAVTGAVGMLVLAALVGGGVWSVDRLDQADRTAVTRYWSATDPLPVPAAPPTVPAGPMTGLLLPVPDGYEPGPDVAEESSSEFAVSGPLAAARIRDGGQGLEAAERAALDRMVRKLKLKGTVARTYRDMTGVLGAEIRLTQADGRGLKDFDSYAQELFKFLRGMGGKSPKVPGHPEAKCYLLPLENVQGKAEDGEKVVSMTCSAYRSGTLVSLSAYGPEPFQEKDAVELLVKQLDRLQAPGESV
ncbi:hypothetical protein [Streptomyces sp. NPDC089919]|uniref:hypothetical protein n=1 Tax=Streptomyces sp. NPDC089919 TaxID=3155188 RepID=UPI00343CACBF